MCHKVRSLGCPVRIELTNNGLLTQLPNYNITQDALLSLFFLSLPSSIYLSIYVNASGLLVRLLDILAGQTILKLS